MLPASGSGLRDPSARASLRSRTGLRAGPATSLCARPPGHGAARARCTRTGAGRAAISRVFELQYVVAAAAASLRRRLDLY
jgi:hypothetical protein